MVVDRRRALVLEPTGNLWGSERALLDFLVTATTSDWEIGVCCPAGSPLETELRRLPVRVFPIFQQDSHRGSRISRLGAAACLGGVAAGFRPRVLHANQAGASRMTLLVARMMRTPAVVHVRMAEDVDHLTSRYRRDRRLERLICVSQYIRTLVDLRLTPCPEISITLYDPYARHTVSGMPAQRHDVPVIACVGRLARSKGQDVLLRSLAVLRREGLDARLAVLGSGARGDNFGTELRHLAHELEIENAIEWQGHRDDVLSRIAGCSVLACPSTREALGRVIFEAWDAGIVPVAGAYSGGCAETIGASGGGILYAEHNPESLANALRSALSLSEDERGQMVERGRAWMRVHCDPQAYANALLAIWHEVATA